MCGIAGIYSYAAGAVSVSVAELESITQSMARRGPDGAGRWISEDGRVALGHRRLSIIDLSERGAQPMLSVDRRTAITFNGEIYNYKSLRRSLEAKGCTFVTESDTEVLLHLYAEKGEDMVDDLRGMFAFCLWDAERGALLLARDPYGIKPLYYADDGTTVRVASQVKALAAGGHAAASPDAAGWVGFLLFGSVPEPFTIYRDVRALPAGSVMWADARGLRKPRRYFSVGGVYRHAEASSSSYGVERLQHEVRDALLDSVRHHLVADVPVGAFLSAGVDSGSLVGLMRDAGQQEIQTITLTFDEFRNTAHDESPVASQIAALYGTAHTNRVVTQREFQDDLSRLLAAMDQPTIDGINTWFVSKAAKEAGLKVAISGLGGDELFGGYSSFRDIPRCVSWMRLPSRVPYLSGAFKGVVLGLTRVFPSLNPKAAGLVKYGGDYGGAYFLRRALFMPWELQRVLDADMVREGLSRLSADDAGADLLTDEGPTTPFGRVAAFESTLYMRNQLLRDTDWASMAHCLEVRVPLVDAALLRRIAPLTVASRELDGKTLLGRSPSRPLPDAVIRRPKTGFATPVERWLGAASPAVARDARARWTRQWACRMLAPVAS